MWNPDTHLEVRQLLPWYLNDSLGEKPREKVIAHLIDCEECRRERDELQVLQGLILNDEDQILDYRPAYAKLTDRVRQTESDKSSVRETVSTRSAITSGSQWFSLSMAATALVAVLFYENFFLTSPDIGLRPDGQFETLTNTGKQVDGIAHRLLLEFEQPISTDTLRAALIETNSNIVSGPRENGSYLVEVVIPEGLSDAEFIRALRRIEGVKSAVFAP